MFRRSALEMRVVVLAPVGRDAALLADTLGGIQIETRICRDEAALLHMIVDGIGAAIIAEEALTPALLQALCQWVDSQPPWSDMPFIVLTTTGRPTLESHRRAQEFQALGNVTFIERPARPDTVQSSARAAL